MTTGEPARAKAGISHLVAFAVAVPAVLVGAVLLAGLVAGWEGVCPMAPTLVKALILLAVWLLWAAMMAWIGYMLGYMLWDLFYCRRRRAYLWFAAVILLAVAAQCLFPPWASGRDSPSYAPLWNPPPYQPYELRDGSMEKEFPVRVDGYSLAWNLYATGVFLVFYARGRLQHHREADEGMRMWRSTQREGPALTYEELQEALRRQIDEAKKDEDIRNTPP